MRDCVDVAVVREYVEEEGPRKLREPKTRIRAIKMLMLVDHLAKVK